GNLRKLTDSDTEKGQLVWSPDSKALLFTASDRGLHKVALDSGKVSTLTRGEVIGFGRTAIGSPQWSPDGQWIAYTRSGRNLLPHVHVIPADGGPERRITDDDTYSDTSPLWTPDGKALVYLAGIDAGTIAQTARANTAQIYIVSLRREDKEPGE